MEFTLEDKIKPLKNNEMFSLSDSLEIEKIIGEKLPKDYIDFFNRYNGCRFNSGFRYYYLPADNELNKKNEELFNEDLSIAEILNSKSTLGELKDNEIENLPKKLLTIGFSSGFNRILMSLRDFDYGSIYYLGDLWEYAESNILFLASSFKELIYGITIHKDITDFQFIIFNYHRYYNILMDKIKYGIYDINQKIPKDPEINYTLPYIDPNMLEYISAGAPYDTYFDDIKIKLIDFLLKNGIDTSDYIPRYSIQIRDFLLKNSKLDINKKNLKGQTALILDCMCGNLSGIKYCLENGADPNIRDNEGKNALDYIEDLKKPSLMFLYNINDFELTTFMIEKLNFSVDMINTKGETKFIIDIKKILNYSSGSGNINDILRRMRFYVEKGADLTIKDNEGKTALDYIEDLRNSTSFLLPEPIDLRDFLIKTFNFHIDKLYLLYKNQTRLFFDCSEGNLLGIKYCLENGADPNIKDNDGKTALDYLLETYSKQNQHPNSPYEKSIKLLQEAMKK